MLKEPITLGSGWEMGRERERVIPRHTPRVPLPAMRRNGAGLVMSLAGCILECEENKFWFVDFNYSTQILFFFF